MKNRTNEATFKLMGVKPLLMSNGHSADPASEWSVKYRAHMARKPNVRTKAVKEDPTALVEWFEEERRIQFHAALYYDGYDYHLPSDNLLFMIQESFFGYNTTSQGSARLLSMLETTAECAYLETYDGPKDPDERFEQGLYRQGMVPNKNLGGSRVRVLHPYFENWSLTVTYRWDIYAETDGMLGRGKTFDADALHEKLIIQGRGFGCGAYRKSPNWGRFEVQRLS